MHYPDNVRLLIYLLLGNIQQLRVLLFVSPAQLRNELLEVQLDIIAGSDTNNVVLFHLFLHKRTSFPICCRDLVIIFDVFGQILRFQLLLASFYKE